MAIRQEPGTGSGPGNELGSGAVMASGLGADDTMPEAALVAAPEIMAGTLVEYLRGWWQRVRGGDSGVLPVIIALAVIVIVFQAQNSLYLSAGNIINLFNQAVVFILFAIAEVFVLLLGEIDLSVAFNAGIGAGLIAVFLAPPYNFPWWFCILIGLAATTAIGLLQGLLITRLGLPSFIVTLAGYIGLQGVMITMFDSFKVAVGGVIAVSNHVIIDLVGYSMTALASWVAMVVVVVLWGVYTIYRDGRRRAAGLVTAPASLTMVKVAAVALAGVALVLISNVNRGTAGGKRVVGVPWSIPVLLAIFALASLLLARTRFGRYVYAIGGNAEAARRAGINVELVRTVAFALAGLVSGLAGLMLLSQLSSISTDIDPTYVLYAVAAAVIGGTSLFGGRGKPLHAVLGGIVIAAVYNGIFLINLGTAANYMVVAVVLVVAVTVDSLARRSQTAR